MFKKLLQLYYKITKEQYEIMVVEYDKEGNMSNTFTIQLKKIIKTDAFKKYSAKEASRKGSVIAGAKKLKYNQPELFEYLLNKEGSVSKEQVIKDFKKFGFKVNKNSQIVIKKKALIHTKPPLVFDENEKQLESVPLITSPTTKFSSDETVSVVIFGSQL